MDPQNQTAQNNQPPKVKPNLLHRIEFLFFISFSIATNLLPRNVAYFLGRLLGRLAYFVMIGRRKIARNNLRLAYPDHSNKDLKKFCKQCFENLALSVVDMFRMGKYTKKDFDTLIDFDGLQHIEEAKRFDKGIIFITGHLGFWESGAFVFPNLGLEVNFVAKRIKNPLINDYILNKRAKGGGSFIDKKNGLRKILKTVSEKKGIAILIDQHMHQAEAVKVPFFGKDAYTSPIVVQLASKRGIPVVPIFCYRVASNRFQIDIGKPIIFESKQAESDMVRNTAAITHIIEMAIRKNPGQWMWIHNRWRD